MSYYIYTVCVRDGYRQCHNILLHAVYTYMWLYLYMCRYTAHTHNSPRIALTGFYNGCIMCDYIIRFARNVFIFYPPPAPNR